MTTAQIVDEICQKYPQAAPHRESIQNALHHMVSHLPEDLPEDKYLEEVTKLLQQLPGFTP